MNRIRDFIRSESGIAVTEYALLVALVAMLLVAVVTVFGTKISSWFTKKTNSITTI
jgi:pilus assembly protein Flp/PilA